MVEIILGVVMFTGVVLALCVFILLARAKLVPSGEVNIEINGDPEKTVVVRPGSKLLVLLRRKKYMFPRPAAAVVPAVSASAMSMRAEAISCPLKPRSSPSVRPVRECVWPVRST